MTPDVNVLVAASRSDHPYHAVARSWLEGAASVAASGSPLVLMPMVLVSFLRLVSSPRIFHEPTPVKDAVAFIDALLAAQGVHLAPLGPEWPRLRQLCVDMQLKGNAVPDAWLAAATIHLGEHLVSFDRDFRKLIGRAQFTLLKVNEARL
ncbi:MAG TPA: TA system VapC family ribonuclease toxin [Burkholderiales bacterium]|nr:TA system VapC family ribonuclease toxin [Burkholderiales bacterium]